SPAPSVPPSPYTTLFRSLELPAGRIVGVIGPDGVGKSSMLSLIAGARAVQQGRVRVLGADMSDARERERVVADIAYMPQGLGTRSEEHTSELQSREKLVC